MNSRRVAAILCGVLAVYLLLSPIYALYHFKEYASSIPLIARYVLAPVVLALFFLAVALFAKPSFALTAGVYALSVLGGLFLFETLLTLRSVPVRMSMLGQLSPEQSAAIAREGDVVRGFTLPQLNRLSDVKDLNRAVLSGFPAQQVILCAQPSSVVSYRADRYGFNNPDSVYDSGRIDVMLLGDSFVEGFCLPPGVDLVSQLRQKAVSAVGFGIRGSGPLTELAMLGRFGPMLRPRHVLIVFFEGNDWRNLEGELLISWLRSALDEYADFGTPQSAGAAMLRARAAIGELNRQPITVADLLARTEVLRNFFALQQTFARLGLNFPGATQDIPEFRHVLRRSKSIVQSWGGSLQLVYVPRVDRYLGAFSARSAFEPLRSLVARGAASEAVPLIDLSTAFEVRPRPQELYGADGHFSDSGAVFAAEIIARHIQDGSIADAAVREGR